MRRIILISNPDRESGGNFQSRVTLEKLRNYNIDVYPIIPDNIAFLDIKDMESEKVIGKIRLTPFRAPLKYAPLKHLAIIIQDFYSAYEISKKVKQKYGTNFFELVFTHHELPRYVYLAHLISKFLGIPKAALLCAPAFYEDDRSTKLRLRSYSLIYSLVYPENLPKRVGKLLNLIAERVKIAIMKPLLSMILKDFDLIIAVSASVAQEMNDEWQGRIRVLDPNTSYEHMHIEAQSREDHRENCKYDAIFFSRLSPEKGILDIPLIWKELVAKGLGTKLAIAGKFEEEEVEKAFFELVDRLSLNEYIEYLGWLPHKKLGVLLQNSKMLIYPSYQDSISFVVMESLAHNKIVVAYDTPAIRCNYPIREVVKVKTGDYRAMAQKINDILVNEEYRNVNLQEFLERFKSWDEVVKSEVKILENARLLKTV